MTAVITGVGVVSAFGLTELMISPGKMVKGITLEYSGG